MGKTASGFTVSPDTKIGREWSTHATKIHNELITNTKSLVDSKQSRFSRQYSKWLKKEERWRPSWEEKTRKKATDKLLKNQVRKIKNAKGGAGTTDCYPNKKAIQYKSWRARNPSYLPGWSESMWIKNQIDRHDDVIRKAEPCVDTRPSELHALYQAFREKNPPLPPIDNPTPSQYQAAKYGRAASTCPVSDRGSVAGGRGMVPAMRAGATSSGGVHDDLEWPEHAGHELIGSDMPLVKPIVDEALVRHIFEMSMNNSTNDNVARLLQERTMAKFPDIFNNLPVI